MPNEPILRTSLYAPTHGEEYIETEKELAKLKERKASVLMAKEQKVQEMIRIQKAIEDKKVHVEKIAPHVEVAEKLASKRKEQHSKEVAFGEEIQTLKKKYDKLHDKAIKAAEQNRMDDLRQFLKEIQAIKESLAQPRKKEEYFERVVDTNGTTLEIGDIAEAKTDGNLQPIRNFVKGKDGRLYAIFSYKGEEFRKPVTSFGVSKKAVGENTYIENEGEEEGEYTPEDPTLAPTILAAETLFNQIANDQEINALFVQNEALVGEETRKQEAENARAFGNPITEKELEDLALSYAEPEGKTKKPTPQFREVTPEEYAQFIDTGHVEEDVLRGIAEKIKAGVVMSNEETAIYSAHASAIEEMLHEDEPTTLEMSDSHELVSLTNLAELVPEFAHLTEGQQNFVREGVLGKLYEYIQTEAQTKLAEKLADQGRLGRIWTGARKNFLLAGYRKELLEEIRANAGNIRADFIHTYGNEITHIIQESGLTAHINEQGAVVGEYLSMELRQKYPEISDLIDTFNQTATELARMPYEWSLPDATKSEQGRYAEAKALFDQGKSVLLEKLESLHGQKETALLMGETETMVRTMSFLFTHPDASVRLRNIAKTPTAVQALKDIVVERGAYTVGSFLSRKALVGTVFGGMTMVALPIIGASIGAWRGHDRAKEKLRQQNKAGRSGEQQKGKTVIGMGSVDRHIERLKKYSDLLGGESDPVKQQILWQELKVRIDFMETKFEMGQLNFGEKEGRFTRQYEFVRALHEAQVAYDIHANKQLVQIYEQGIKDGALHNVRGLVERMGAKNQKDVRKSRASFVRKQTFYSALYGSLFAEAGAVFGYWTSRLGWSSHPEHPSVRDFTKTPHKQIDTYGVKIDESTLPEKNIAGLRNDIDQYLRTGTNGSNGAQEVATPPHTPSVSETIKTPEAPTIVPLEKAVSEVALGRGAGGGQAVFDFKHTQEFNSLAPDVKKFFDRDIWKVAKDLKLISSEGKESALIHAGAKFGVTADNKIFLTDPSDPLHPKILGHFEKGTFVADDAKLTYTKEGMSQSFIDKDGTLYTPETPAEKPSIHLYETNTEVDSNANTLQTERLGDTVVKAEKPFVRQIDTPATKSVEANTLTQKLEQTPTTETLTQAPKNIFSNSRTINDYKFSPDQLREIKTKTDSAFYGTLDNYFGEKTLFGDVITHGAETTEWINNRNVPAEMFMQHAPEDLQPHYGKLLTTLQKMANRLGEMYDVQPKEKTIEEYTRFLFDLDAKNNLIEGRQ